MWKSANMAFGLCPMLTGGAIEAIAHHASDELKQKYLPKMVEGTWSGTMNLTEPNAGSDLAAIITKAKAGRRRHLPGQPAPRSSSPGASTTAPRTSSTSCWPACRMRRRD